MRREHIVLEEIIRACDRSTDLALRMVDDLDGATPDQRDALLWNLSVIGEAIAQLDRTFTAQHPGIPWQDPVRTRNRIIHGYWSVDMRILVETARTHVPQLRAGLARIARGLDS